jgi:hypothetical protein
MPDMNVGKAILFTFLLSAAGTVNAAEQLPPKTMGLIEAPLPRQIQTGNRTIYLYAREGKPTRFTVKTADGEVLAKKATLDDLQRKDPALASFIRNALHRFRAARPTAAQEAAMRKMAVSH